VLMRIFSGKNGGVRGRGPSGCREGVLE